MKNIFKYRNGAKALHFVSQQKGKRPEDMALEIVEEKAPQIIKYIKFNGYTPAKTAEGIATQAALIHEEKIKSYIRDGYPYEEAEEIALSETESEGYDGDYNDFAPALIAVIGNAGKAGIEAINKKREKEGQKPILSGAFWQQFKKKTQGVDVGSDNDDLLLRIKGNESPYDPNNPFSAIAKQIEEDKKREYLQKNLPLIILVTLVLIGLAYYIGRKHK